MDENEKKEKIEIEGEDAEEDEDDEGEESEEDDIDAVKEILMEVEMNMRSNDKNRLDEHYVIRYFES